MELLKCKFVIALVVMVLGVSYMSGSDNVAVQSQAMEESEVSQTL